MKILVLGVALACLVACNKVTYVNPATIPTGQVAEETGHYFIAGLAGKKDIYPSQHCPEGVSSIQSRFTFGDIILTIVTLTLYAPRTYEIRCGRSIAR